MGPPASEQWSGSTGAGRTVIPARGPAARRQPFFEPVDAPVQVYRGAARGPDRAQNLAAPDDVAFFHGDRLGMQEWTERRVRDPASGPAREIHVVMHQRNDAVGRAMNGVPSGAAISIPKCGWRWRSDCAGRHRISGPSPARSSLPRTGFVGVAGPRGAYQRGLLLDPASVPAADLLGGRPSLMS